MLQSCKLEFDFILLNPHCSSTDNYIIDSDIKSDFSFAKNKIVIRMFTRNSKYDFIEIFVLNYVEELNYIDTEAKKSRVLEAPFQQTKSSIKHCDENKFEKYFYKYISIINNSSSSSFSNYLNQSNYVFYSINEENFCLYKAEEEIILHSLLPTGKQENAKELVLMQNYTNLYCSHLHLEDFLIINYEKELVILKNNVVLVRLAHEKINSRNILVVNNKLGEHSLLCFYDNQMNMVFAKIDLNLLNKAFEKAASTKSKMINLKHEEKMDIVDENREKNTDETKFIDGIEYLKDNIPLEILNQYDNGSNYCMDSAMLNNKNASSGFDSAKVFAVCGERGNSKLVQYEKALKEIRLTSFDYNEIRGAFLAENACGSEKVLFFNTFYGTKAFYYGVENGQIKFYELKLKDEDNNNCNAESNNVIGDGEVEKTLDAFYLNDHRMIIHFTNKKINIFSLLSSSNDMNNNENKLALIETVSLKGNNDAKLKILNSMNDYLMKMSIEDSEAHILAMKNINSSKDNCIFIALMLSNFKVSILKADFYNDAHRIQHEITIDYYTTVSAFDITLSNDCLLIITGTYDNKLEILNYDFSKKQFHKINECLLEAENSDIVPESIKIAADNQLVFVSTRIGKFAIFSLDQLNSSLNFLGSFNPKSDEIEPLSISDCRIKANNNYELTLYSNNNAYLLELKFSDDWRNMTSKLNKYLVEKKMDIDCIKNNKVNNKNESNFCANFGLKNCINFFLNLNLANIENEENTAISIYQNNSLVCISHFQKVHEHSLLINTVKLYENNVLAKKIIALNDSNLCVLYNENQNQSLKWKLNLININDLKEKVIAMETQNELKIFVIKTFEIDFHDIDYSDEENKIKYLILAGEFTQIESNDSLVKKGIFFIYRIDFTKNNSANLEYVKKYCIADPIYDLSQLKNNIILTCNNYIYSTSIEVDDVNRNIEIIPKNKQPHMNKLISCESITDSNFVVVGDVSESFNLMEFDSKSFRFEVVAAELSLKSLYKGNNNDTNNDNK